MYENESARNCFLLTDELLLFLEPQDHHIFKIVQLRPIAATLKILVFKFHNLS